MIIILNNVKIKPFFTLSQAVVYPIPKQSTGHPNLQIKLIFHHINWNRCWSKIIYAELPLISMVMLGLLGRKNAHSYHKIQNPKAKEHVEKRQQL